MGGGGRLMLNGSEKNRKWEGTGDASICSCCEDRSGPLVRVKGKVTCSTVDFSLVAFFNSCLVKELGTSSAFIAPMRNAGMGSLRGKKGLK